jgi:hypothetical protein
MTNSLIESARRLGAIDAYGNTASAVEALAKVQIASGMPGGTGYAQALDDVVKYLSREVAALRGEDK